MNEQWAVLLHESCDEKYDLILKLARIYLGKHFTCRKERKGKIFKTQSLYIYIYKLRGTDSGPHYPYSLTNIIKWNI
jgi:hypothetical protein